MTSVNDSRYCKWLHTHWAISEGVPRATRSTVLSGERHAPREARKRAEAAAILFGRRYAERRDRVAPESLEKLRSHYSDAQVEEILAYVRFITFANLLGNTADAFFDRFSVAAVGAAASPLALLMLFVAQFDGDVCIDELSPWRRRHRAGSRR